MFKKAFFRDVSSKKNISEKKAKFMEHRFKDNKEFVNFTNSKIIFEFFEFLVRELNHSLIIHVYFHVSV